MPLFCSRCGSENPQEAQECSKCGSTIGHLADAPAVDEMQGSGKATWIITAVVCVAYLVYPSMSVFELIPDAIPILGSLDEAAATTGLFIALSRLGVNPFSKWTDKPFK